MDFCWILFLISLPGAIFLGLATVRIKHRPTGKLSREATPDESYGLLLILTFVFQFILGAILCISRGMATSFQVVASGVLSAFFSITIGYYINMIVSHWLKIKGARKTQSGGA